MQKKQKKSERRKLLEEYAGVKVVRSFNDGDFSRCVKIILSFDDDKVRDFINEMYVAQDNTDGEKSAKIIYICEYLLCLYADFKDKYDPVEFVYSVCRQLNKNLRIISNRPDEYYVEEELIMCALDKFNHKLGELRRKPEREVPEYVTDNTPFDFYYLNS